MIVPLGKKHGRKFALVTRDRVYVHDTKHAAEAQEAAINLAKARRAGKRIPRKPARRLRGAQWERLYRHRRSRW